MSSINPNNINGTYPIAGQDNDSQGFRDNFTNIKNNFTFAATELSDLQNNAILKTALSGTTLNNNMNYAPLIAPQLLRAVETVNALGVVASATKEIDWATAHFHSMTTGAATTLTFTNWPVNSTYTSLKLIINCTDVSHTVTFATVSGKTYTNLDSLQNISDHTITFPAIGTYFFEFSTYNNGDDIIIRDLLQSHNSGSFLSTNQLGFKTGGNVAQATSKTTAVILNTSSGQITTDSEGITGGEHKTFRLQNSKISSRDVLIVNLASGAAGVGVYTVQVDGISNGNANITIENISGDTHSDTLVINFAVIQGASS